jgi:hypothetical protein
MEKTRDAVLAAVLSRLGEIDIGSAATVRAAGGDK